MNFLGVTNIQDVDMPKKYHHNMKKIIATSQNYNSLQMIRSITYFYEDGTSSTHEVFTKRDPKKVKSTLDRIIDKCNQNNCKK